MSASSRKRSTNRGGTAGNSGKDAIALLKQDHKNVKQLLKRLEGTTDRNAGQREELLIEIEKEMKIHSAIEEEIFYPAFKESLRSKSDVHLYFEALEYHRVVDLVMPEIRNAYAESEEFAAKAKVLKDLIEHHAEEEEKQMFPKAHKSMGISKLREVGEELEERKEELKTSVWGRTAGTIRGRRRIA